jgi:Holliday junction resolvasome RuvABC endonuclease subunit
MKRKRLQGPPPKKVKGLRILALDPGTVNFGWACLEVNRKNTKIVKCGMLVGLVKNLVGGLEKDVETYTKAIRRLLRKSRATVLLSERYSTRIRGTTGEAVNIMIGIAVREFLNKEPSGQIEVFMPMTWKAAVKKYLETDIPPFYKECAIKPHPVDACFVGIYWGVRSKVSKWPNRKTLAKHIHNAYIQPT